MNIPGRDRIFSLPLLVLSACGTAETNWEELQDEIGRTIADVTLVAGMPQRVGDLPGGRRVYEWDRWHLVPRGGRRCTYRLFAISEGRPQSLAAWRVVAIDEPRPGCGPLEAGKRPRSDTPGARPKAGPSK